MKPPQFVTNLYRDLRDRRLLPLVVILPVAILALPVLLGEDSEAPPPPPAGAVAGEEEIPTLPAVLASDPAVRDYRERLDSLSSKDPFAQQFAGPSEKAAEAASVSKVQLPSGGTGGSGDFAAPIGGATSSSTDSPSTSTSTSASTGGSTSGSVVSTSEGSDGGGSGSGASSGSGQGGSTSSGGRWFTYRIDVTTGRAGQAEQRKNVKRGTVLPSQSNPVALFLGASEGGNRANFLVSTDVDRSHGEGSCIPSPSDCPILTLKRGQERRFDYAPNGERDTFVIKLDAIRLVEVDEPGGSTSSSSGKGSRAANAGLKSFLGL